MPPRFNESLVLVWHGSLTIPSKREFWERDIRVVTLYEVWLGSHTFQDLQLNGRPTRYETIRTNKESGS